MRAVYFSGGNIEFRTNHTPQAPKNARDELIRVDVLQAGICETDLQLKQGYMGFAGVPGHEFVGVPRTGKFAGRRVVGEINCACHDCSFCHRGMPRHCRNRTVIGILNHEGAFADALYVPEENLLPVPDHVPTRHAVFTEPVAAACRILEQVSIGASDQVVIFGAGRLGNLCAQVIQTTGCELTVVGKHQWKLDRLKIMGMDTCSLQEFVPGADADFVVDCTGSASGFESALRTVRPCGTVIQKTTIAAAREVHLAPVVIDEVTVLGSRCGPFAPALDLLSDGTVDVAPLITAEYPLEDAIRAFQHAEQPDALKVLLSVGE